MTVQEWSKSEIEYGRRVLDSGLEGVRSGRDAFLNGKPLTPFLSGSVGQALKPAVLGLCIGMISSCRRNGHRSVGKTLAFGLLGGAIGFGAGMAWKSRHLTRCITSEALRNISKARDEHWLERHPIDYA